MLNNSIIAGKQNRFSKRFQENMMDLFGESYTLPDDFNYRVVIVSHEHIARPDLISKSVYGTDVYGDLICKLNGISNPFELNEDMSLYIPDLNDLEKFIFPAVKEENIEDDETDVRNDKPSYKKPKEKRAANEAIIGDSRFKIDKTNRVIIY